MFLASRYEPILFCCFNWYSRLHKEWLRRKNLSNNMFDASFVLTLPLQSRPCNSWPCWLQDKHSGWEQFVFIDIVKLFVHVSQIHVQRSWKREGSRQCPFHIVHMKTKNGWVPDRQTPSGHRLSFSTIWLGMSAIIYGSRWIYTLWAHLSAFCVWKVVITCNENDQRRPRCCESRSGWNQFFSYSQNL